MPQETNYWQDKKVLVTGASGFLGSWLSVALTKSGACVAGFTPDLRDAKAVSEFLQKEKPEVVFHLGAQTMADTGRESPLATFETNVGGTWNVLEACRSVENLKCVIVASSEKAYGNFYNAKSYDEDTPLTAQDPYGASKAAADIIARSYFYTYGLPVAITRCGNFFGGGDLNWRRIVPATMRAIFLGEKLRVPSASAAIRDCFYVEDAALAYMMLAEKMSDKSIHGQAFNFGAGMPTTVLDLARRIIEIAKSDVLPEIARGEVKSPSPLPLDMRKAENILGWSPSWTLEAGISKTLDWYRAFFQK